MFTRNFWASASLLGLLSSVSPAANSGQVTHYLDTRIRNETGQTANDFHMTMTFSTPSGLGFTDPGGCPQGSFALPGASGTFRLSCLTFQNLPRGGLDVLVDLSNPAANVAPNTFADIFLPFPLVNFPTFTVTAAYWTLGKNRINIGIQPDTTKLRNSFTTRIDEPSTLLLVIAAIASGAALMRRSQSGQHS